MIRFIEEYTVKSTPPVTHKVNDTLDCSRASEEHFIDKGVAIRVEKKEAPRAPKSAPATSASQVGRVSRKKTAKKSKAKAR